MNNRIAIIVLTLGVFLSLTQTAKALSVPDVGSSGLLLGLAVPAVLLARALLSKSK
jgi:protein with PEP-CTERM/exosortase system signal